MNIVSLATSHFNTFSNAPQIYAQKPNINCSHPKRVSNEIFQHAVFRQHQNVLFQAKWHHMQPVAVQIKHGERLLEALGFRVNQEKVAARGQIAMPIGKQLVEVCLAQSVFIAAIIQAAIQCFPLGVENADRGVAPQDSQIRAEPDMSASIMAMAPFPSMSLALSSFKVPE